MHYPVVSLLAVVGLAMVHIFAGKLRYLGIPRRWWLSLAGGVSVAYVFVHIFPELEKYQSVIEYSRYAPVAFLEHHVYLLALMGLATFYGLERLALQSRSRGRNRERGDVSSTGTFWVHVGSFAMYNAIIGYLLLNREETGLANLILFAAAMALHFLVNDDGLREHHKHRYQGTGRWMLAAGAVGGWMLGMAYEVSPGVLAVLFSFVAGGIILNILKEELPEERESQFWAFALGALLYTALLLLTG